MKKKDLNGGCHMSTIYIRLKKQITFDNQKSVRLFDIAWITGGQNQSFIEAMYDEKLCNINQETEHYIVIEAFQIVKLLTNIYPNIDFQVLGPNQTIVEVTRHRKRSSALLVSFVWLLLFIGSAMTIMNFHEDVNMLEVQQKLHYFITGDQSEFPLWIQIPYSIGLGAGMILFFNHWFKKKFNEEPSPLEVEMFKYQEELQRYLAHHENTLNSYNDHLLRD